ncbi:hypothetical protein BDV18DRAFT_152870 [Aspergillus unguis]
MNTDAQPPVSEALRSTAIPIAQISPDDDRLQQSSIHAVVTLLWPYSSSTKSLSVLLAEPDFRLRRSNGQVKVFFHGHVAEEVARTHVGIGDSVYLSLAGSRLGSNDAATQTPGRSVPWDVHFDASAFLEVWRDSKLLATVKVDRASITPPPPDSIAVDASTPAPNNSNTPVSKPLGSTSWQSPAFLGKSRVSFGFTDSAIDPFVEDDGYVPGKGRKRPRFSMQNSTWRVVDEPESPRDKDLPEDWMAIFDEELANGSDAGGELTNGADAEESAIPPASETSEASPVVDTDVAMSDAEADVSAQKAVQATGSAEDDAQFIRPSFAPRSIPELKLNAGVPGFESHLPTDTPRLHPIPSPGLPDPSPLATKANSPHGYFPSTLDAASAAQPIVPCVPATEEIREGDDTATPPQIQPDGEPTHTDEDDAVTVYTDDMQILPDSVPNSGDANFSSQAPNSTATTAAVRESTNIGEQEEESDQPGVEIAEEASGSDTESDLESEQSLSEERIAPSSVEEEEDEDEEDYDEDEEGTDVSIAKEPSGRLAKEAEDGSGISSTSGSDENVNEVSNVSEKYRSRFAERESLLPEARPVAASKDGHDHDEEDVIDQSDKDSSVEGGYEDEYDQYDDEDRPRHEYDYSESEDESDESDEEEELPPKPKPQNSEPEVIVLDSDSEDEARAPPVIDPVKRETEENSDEDSYDTKEEDRSSDDFDEAAQSEDDELEAEEEEDGSYTRDAVGDEPESMEEDEQEEMDDNYGQGKEQTVQEEHEDMAEDERDEAGDDLAKVHEQPEQMDEDIRDGGLATQDHENIHDQLHMTMGEIPAGSALSHDQNLEPYEFMTPHQESITEEFQAVTGHSQPNHDSLDYLATVSESAQRLHAISQPIQPGFDMAIDPTLYDLGTPQENNMAEPATEDDQPREHAVENDETRPGLSGNSAGSHLALQLDGAAPPATFFDTTDMQSPIRHETQQVITPGPPQPVDIDKALEASEPLNEMLPTPNLTQDALMKLETEESPEILAEEKTPEAPEKESPQPAAHVKIEDDFVVSEHEEHEPESLIRPPIVVVDAAASPSPDEDQKLQASIEVDDQPQTPVEESGTRINRHYPGLRSKLSYFAPLATLIDHYNAVVDTISIAIEIAPPVKANAGSKDFIMTLQLTDPSMAGTTIYAQLIRPYKSALPTVREGDAILLRNFRVKSFDHSIILVSDSTSAWAVFSPSAEDPEVAGPPVEYGNEELSFATDLRQWYLENGMAMVADNQLQASVGLESRAETPTSSAAPSDAGSIDLALRETRGETSSSRGSRRRKSHRRITIHELRDGRRYTEVGSSPGDESIHELRDGTVYANL